MRTVRFALLTFLLLTTYAFADGFFGPTSGGGGVTAPVSVANGGTGGAPSGDDQALISDSSSAATWRTINDCVGAGKALTYSQATNALGCNTISAGAASAGAATILDVSDGAGGFTATSCSVAAGANKPLSCPGATAGTELFGLGATAGASDGGNNTIVGNAASVASTGSYSTVIGKSAASGAGNANIAIGNTSNAGSGNSNTVVGYTATITGGGASNVVIGRDSTTAASNDVIVGYDINAGSSTPVVGLGIGVRFTANNQFVAGGSAQPMNDVYFGKGVTNATPTAYTIHGTGGSGADNVGGDLKIAPGISTGAGAPANVKIQSTTAAGSSSTAQTLADAVIVGAAGRVTFGSAVDAANAVDIDETAGCITIEGSTANAFEDRICVTDPTVGDGLFNLPNLAGATTVTLAHTGAPSQTFSGVVQFNAQMVVGLDQVVNDNTGIWMPTFAVASNHIGPQTSLTPDSSMFATGTTSNSWHINESQDRAFDFNNGPCGTSACTDPTLIVHSHNQTTTEWVSLAHDGTNGVLDVGAGVVSIPDGVKSTYNTLFGGIWNGATLRPDAGNTLTLAEDGGATALQISTAGDTSVTGTFTASRTTDIGWSVVLGANTACNTTCTNACVVGFATGVVGSDTERPVACTDASADRCLCAGAS